MYLWTPLLHYFTSELVHMIFRSIDKHKFRTDERKAHSITDHVCGQALYQDRPNGSASSAARNCNDLNVHFILPSTHFKNSSPNLCGIL